MELLKRLCDAPGVSGYEDEVREIIQKEVGIFADSVYVDHLGNLFMTKGAEKKGPHLMFAAHTDEVGLMVKRVDEGGFIRFMAVGGIDPRALMAKRVRIGKDKTPGVICAKPVHLDKEEKKLIPIKDMRIDIGASSRSQAERYCEPGAPIVFDTMFESRGDILQAKAFDDRAGCYMMAELIKEDFNLPVTFVWTVQEEVGLRGGRLAAARVRPDLMMVLEGTGAGDIPPAADVARNPFMGKGPVITILDWSVSANQDITELLTETADKGGIPWQYKRPLIGGTDAGAAVRVKALAPVVLAVPCRYIHSPVALAYRKDIINTIRLVKSVKDQLREVLS
ncbi:M42 family peptidase [candidate division WOR-3 bacterium]|uniref:M42 family peptidase n=1 Tax=candidate division WOR-3 bacterium TaxID=2052148 RepID=A0A9D5KB42_UNCW3|nr:M42 family peptidase [candidate division WOR-3 bacterium]MBD3364900.1 M42 family peptidase [candidate division WOR-3 bacterium]